MKYNPRIIEEMAERLYARADSAELWNPLLFGLAGAVVGFVLGSALAYPKAGALTGAVLLGAVGYSIGQQRAFALRLQAQLMLVQTKIEENTRPKETPGWVPQPGKETRAAARRISDAFSR